MKSRSFKGACDRACGGGRNGGKIPPAVINEATRLVEAAHGAETAASFRNLMVRHAIRAGRKSCDGMTDYKKREIEAASWALWDTREGISKEEAVEKRATQYRVPPQRVARYAFQSKDGPENALVRKLAGQPKKFNRG